MTKKEIIQEIIRIQTSKRHLFVKVAKEKSLKRLNKSELMFIYNISYNVK